ncbi:platelet endothelial cell adhesion molecule-like isoform X2 [Solea solea]|uniref:platelet endothelial cell adhesion molecule-like isoform X2 n=1 Tax=Solea solea TaxID=90069 RepID=UPI002729C3C9|nr:platelet endothelial cell adhesion molecule-like isoform X2 [Solea solea]
MVLLRLLTFTLLSSYFHPGTEVDAQRTFKIRSIMLTIEPGTDVTRDTNVTVRCKATVSSSSQEALSREYTIYKDSSNVYTKRSSTAEDLLYLLPNAKVSNSGKYKCKITIEGKEMTSEATKLTVTGLSKPVLQLNKNAVSEGEEVTAWCTAPGETGSIFFYLYEDSKVIQEHSNSNPMEAKLRFRKVGLHKVHCAYAVLVMPNTFNSVESNTITVSVKELSITPVLEIFPQDKVYEGDQLSITCNIRNVLYSPENTPIYLYLSHGTKLLSSGENKVNHTMVALAKDPGDFECRLEKGQVDKVTTKMVSVTELFSSPTLTMFPADVFKGEFMSLTCRSESYASERINEEELTYTLEPSVSPLTSTKPGVFSGRALPLDFNYTCEAQAKGIKKRSETMTVRPKVSVSTPKISVVGRAILGKPVKIRCHSDFGSFPINYTLLRGYDILRTNTVKLPTQEAVFTVTINNPEEIRKYMCEAQNNPKTGLLSSRLNATLIEPLRGLTLTVLPDLPEISEGNQLYLICGTKGTPPVTYKFYRVGDKRPLLTKTLNENNTYYHVNKLSKEHSGTYYCEADNHANNVVRSENVIVEVRMALWKKALIGGVCLLVVSVLVAVCVLYIKSKRDAAPLYDGTEGRATNGTRGSVASRPADISNWSSYTFPAKV